MTKLAVKQILLGHDAKKDETNVVEVTTKSWKRDGTEEKIPIAVLKLGETQAIISNLEFGNCASVKFKLTVGSGPVHIVGLQFPDVVENALGGEEVSGTTPLRDTITGVVMVLIFQEAYFDEEGEHGLEEEEEEDLDDEVEEPQPKPKKSNGGKK